jgi:predicted DNA-binding transcriptional regulator YafY
VIKARNLIERLGQRPLTIKEVAETCGVSERHAYRIIDMIKSDLGIRIESDVIAGVNRYFIDLPTNQPLTVNYPAMPLTPKEALTLRNVMVPPPALEQTSLGTWYRLLIRRLSNQHEGADVSTGTVATVPAFSILRPMRKRYEQYSVTLEKILDAINQRYSIKVSYQSPRAHEPREHLVHPLHVVDHRGGLYLFARFPALKDEIRVLAVDRMSGVEQLFSQPFKYPADFDPQGQLDKVFDFTLGDPLMAVIRFDASETPYIKEREWSSAQTIEVHPDGSCTLTMETSGHDDVARWVLGFGGKAQVFAPESLKAKVRDALKAGLKRYG